MNGRRQCQCRVVFPSLFIALVKCSSEWGVINYFLMSIARLIKTIWSRNKWQRSRKCFPSEHHADSLACRFYDLPQNCSGCQSLEFVPSAPDLCNVRASLPLPFFLLSLPLFAKVINPNFGSAGSHKNWSGGKGSSCDQIGADFEICNEWIEHNILERGLYNWMNLMIH